MFKEYALDPALLTNWKDFRYFTEKMGAEQGRLISRYPKRWKRLVYDGLDESIGELERKRIEEALRNINDKLLSRSGDWSNETGWLENAENEHKRTAFSAILSINNPRNHPHVLVGDETYDGVDAWNAITQLEVEREPEAMAKAIAPLLRYSRELIFVDPYFSPDNARYRSVLTAFLNAAKDNATGPLRIRFIRKSKGSSEWFTNECMSRLPRLIPKNLRLEVFTFDERVNGEKLHDRFILTDRWGVQFSVGLDAGSSGQTTLITLLSENIWRSTYGKYGSECPAFDVIGVPVIVQGSA